MQNAICVAFNLHSININILKKLNPANLLKNQQNKVRFAYRLCLNVSKSKLMLFRNQRRYSMSKMRLNMAVIETIQKFDFLGQKLTIN